MATKNLLKTLREKNLSEIGAETAQTAASALKSELNEDWKTFMRQALGKVEEAKHVAQEAQGDLEEGQELVFSKKEKKAEVEPGIDYRREILHAEVRHEQAENRGLSQKLEEIRVELKKIVETSKELEATFKEVVKETTRQTVKPGKYHVNFFEWMLATIQDARVRIESSASWINAISTKKSKKDYWNLSKQHGTSFSLSGERVVAQQTG